MATTERYWDGERWTSQVVPVGSSTAATGPSTFADGPVFAWAIAALPIVWVPLAYVWPTAAHSPITLVVLVAVSVFLAMLDGKNLAATNVPVEEAWAFLGGVGYLVARKRQVAGGWALVATWAAGAVVALLALTSFAQVYTVSGGDAEAAALSFLEDQGVTTATVHCPSSSTGRSGTTFECPASTSGGGSGTITVTIGADKQLGFAIRA